MVKILIRALRLPFITASALPFIFGSLIQRDNFNGRAFLLGLFAAISAHLSANLMNDYADSRSGVDSLDKNYYNFFGGSKLIQEGRLSERFYLFLALFFALISLVCVILLSAVLGAYFVIWAYLVIIFLSWQYSAGPLKFSYRFLGELFIFILFGPACVMGGYFIQTGIFPDAKSFVLSLPFGFFTTAILFANEIPDFSQDRQARKFTWVNLLGQKSSFILYYILLLLGFFSILAGVYLGFLGFPSLLSLALVPLGIKAGRILRESYADKFKLMESSKITIAIQSLAGLFLILGVLL